MLKQLITALKTEEWVEVLVGRLQMKFATSHAIFEIVDA